MSGGINRARPLWSKAQDGTPHRVGHIIVTPYAASLLDVGKQVRLALHGQCGMSPRAGRLVPSEQFRRVLVEGLTLDELATVPGYVAVYDVAAVRLRFG